MKCCPKCRTKQLAQAKTKKYGVALDYCPACKGIWFDRGELEILLNTPSEALQMPPRTERSSLICPLCREPMRSFFFPRTLVSVEMCPACNGLWLEHGEFKEIGTVTRHLRRSGVVPDKAAVSSEAPESPLPTGLKGALIEFINDTISSLSGW